MSYAHEQDPDAARASRMALLAELATRPAATLTPAHLGAPFTALR